MRGCQLVHVIPFTVGRLIAMKTGSVPGCSASFGIPDGIAGKVLSRPRRTGAALEERTDDEACEKEASGPQGLPSGHG